MLGEEEWGLMLIMLLPGPTAGVLSRCWQFGIMRRRVLPGVKTVLKSERSERWNPEQKSTPEESDDAATPDENRLLSDILAGINHRFEQLFSLFEVDIPVRECEIQACFPLGLGYSWHSREISVEERNVVVSDRYSGLKGVLRGVWDSYSPLFRDIPDQQRWITAENPHGLSLFSQRWWETVIFLSRSGINDVAHCFSSPYWFYRGLSSVLTVISPLFSPKRAETSTFPISTLR